MPLHPSRRAALATTAIAAGLLGSALPARAQDASAINGIESQIKQLQHELQSLKRDMANKEAQVRAAKKQAQQAQTQAQQAQQQATAAQAQAAAVQSRVNVAPPTMTGGYPPPYSGMPQYSYTAASPAPSPSMIAGPSENAGPYSFATNQVGVNTKPYTGRGTFRIGDVTVTLGGFLAGESVYRTKNGSADISTAFGAIPFNQSPLAHEGEFRTTAKQSRLSILAFGDPTPNTRLTGYYEMDFLGAAATANSNESNSYNLRVRQLFAAIDHDDREDDIGLHFLAGQAWSLLTPNLVGAVPRLENIPLTIDPQYQVGFTWARQAQVRLSTDLDDHKLWLAVSAESPQTTFGTSGYGTATTYPAGANGLILPGGGFANVNNPGGLTEAPTTNYSNNVAPDLIAKAAWDPGFGHYEILGIMRFMTDRVDALGTGHNNTAVGGGGGANTVIPVIPGLNLQASLLGGYGMGRYGSGQLADATISPNGSLQPLPEILAMGGFVSHPIPSIDFYGYLGTEQIMSRVDYTVGGKGYGYGSPLLVNTGCGTELSTLGCGANNKALYEGTLGAWWRPYTGNYGTFQTGIQYSHVLRQAWSGIGGAPKSNEDLIEVSFRYYPFY